MDVFLFGPLPTTYRKNKLSAYHAKYFAYDLTRQLPANDIGKLTASLQDAQVDLNPHQVEAALFAFKSPLSKGAVLADEVGLGKTIEAGIILSQQWAERKRKLLIIGPSNLRKQWNRELADKFYLPSVILEAKSFNNSIKEGNLNPFNQEDTIIICSYHFAKNKAPYLKHINWDLVIIDEAHRLRNVYKPSNKIGNGIKDALDHCKKVLLTATPLQNSILELYGLVSLIDPYIFGDLKSFKSQFSRNIDEENYTDLRNRLQPICKRTLRRQVLILSKNNVEFKNNVNSYRIIETNFEQSPLLAFQGAALKDRVLAYLNFENAQLTQVLINEAIINELIFEVYELSDADREQVEAKMGLSIGSLAVFKEAKDAFIAQLQNPLGEVTKHIQNLPITTFDEPRVREIKEAFATLYQSNNDLEEFCIRHQVNPINVWCWFKEAQTVPAARAAEIALEFLADNIRTLLQQDEDGIIPLVGLPGEEALSQRLEQHCLQNGFTAAQYMQLDSLLGRSVNEYLEHHFFNQLSNHLNLFRHLPKTPFIWHLSSGPHQGLEVYVLVYKWNRDSLFKLKSHYISHRVQNLEYRQITLQDVNTAQAQTEKETIRLQLEEIKLFTTKIDELIAEGYDPILDDGVGKNIAPLQKKGLLRAEVLKTTGGAKSQLEKYLKASW